MQPLLRFPVPLDGMQGDHRYVNAHCRSLNPHRPDPLAPIHVSGAFPILNSSIPWSANLFTRTVFGERKHVVHESDFALNVIINHPSPNLLKTNVV
jgi:hypothetical protein